MSEKSKALYKRIQEGVAHLKEKIKDGWNGDVVVAHEFGKNIKQVLEDLENGTAFEDGHANENLKSTIVDMAKMAGIGAIFVLPGGSAGVIALKKFLNSSKAKKMRIPNFLELSISMKTSPLNILQDIPIGADNSGAFGTIRKYDIHSGIDLYCNPGDTVHAIECGTVVGIIDFTGEKAESPWWNDTRAVLVEGASGVFAYGEITEREGLKIGDDIECGDVIGQVVTVLKHDKGLPMTMLHIELYEHKHRDVLWWKLGESKPDPLMDPTNILLEIKKKI